MDNASDITQQTSATNGENMSNMENEQLQMEKSSMIKETPMTQTSKTDKSDKAFTSDGSLTKQRRRRMFKQTNSGGILENRGSLKVMLKRKGHKMVDSKNHTDTPPLGITYPTTSSINQVESYDSQSIGRGSFIGSVSLFKPISQDVHTNETLDVSKSGTSFDKSQAGIMIDSFIKELDKRHKSSLAHLDGEFTQYPNNEDIPEQSSMVSVKTLLSNDGEISDKRHAQYEKMQDQNLEMSPRDNFSSTVVKEDIPTDTVYETFSNAFEKPRTTSSIELSEIQIEQNLNLDTFATEAPTLDTLPKTPDQSDSIGEHGYLQEIIIKPQLDQSRSKEKGYFRRLFKAKRKPKKNQHNNAEEPRQTWLRKADFTVACIAITVGLGNVWHIIKMCFIYDGGAFIIAYTITATLIAFPVLILEVSIGQFMCCGGMKLWNICPLFKGVSITTSILITLLLCNENVVISWVLFYIFASFSGKLPWSHCKNPYNTPNCSFSNQTILTKTTHVLVTHNDSVVTFRNHTDVPDKNSTVVYLANYTKPIIEFWERNVLDLSSSVYTLGTLQWQTSLIVLLVWGLVFGIVVLGIQSVSKILYVTVAVPYLLMIALFIQVLISHGGSYGIDYFFTPKFSHLTSMNIWSDACQEVVFSLCIGMGVLPVIGSYNNYFHDNLRDLMVFMTVNLLSVFLFGMFIFALIGPTIEHNKPYTNAGPSLIFLVYPHVLLQLPLPALWSIMFYTMIFFMAIDYQIFGTFTVVTSIVDYWPKVFPKGKQRALLTCLYCISTYILGLFMCTQGSLYVYSVYKTVSTTKLLVFVCTVEICVISWIYGTTRFIDNFTIMTGRQIGRSKAYWQYIVPIYLLVFLLYGVLSDEAIVTKSAVPRYQLPTDTVKFCRFLSTMIATPIPGYAFYMVVVEWRLVRERKGTLDDRIGWDDRHELLEILKRFTQPNLPYFKQRRLYDRVSFASSKLICSKGLLRESSQPITLLSRSCLLHNHMHDRPKYTAAQSVHKFTFQESEQQFNILCHRSCEVTVDVDK